MGAAVHTISAQHKDISLALRTIHEAMGARRPNISRPLPSIATPKTGNWQQTATRQALQGRTSGASPSQGSTGLETAR